MTLPPIADLHCDTLLELQGGADIASNPEGHVDIPRLRKGGIGLQVFAAFVSSTLPADGAFAEANALFDLFDGMCAAHPETFSMVRTAQEAEEAVRSGKVAAVPAIENGHAIECDLRKLESLARRGMRYMTLTHVRHLPWAASSNEEGDGPGGLTGFGRQVVAALQGLGVIVDVSHVHEKTFWDVVHVAKRPFIASHSCAAALCPMPRNLSDDQIRAIGASGGVVGLNFYPAFVDPCYLKKRGASMASMFANLERFEIEYLHHPARRNAEIRRAAREAHALMGPAEAGLDTLCDHLDHIVDLAGEEAVAFGSDFDGITDLPQGITGCASILAILRRLRTRGWSEKKIHKLAWGNFLRVMKATE